MSAGSHISAQRISADVAGVTGVEPAAPVTPVVPTVGFGNGFAGLDHLFAGFYDSATNVLSPVDHPRQVQPIQVPPQVANEVAKAKGFVQGLFDSLRHPPQTGG